MSWRCSVLNRCLARCISPPTTRLPPGLLQAAIPCDGRAEANCIRDEWHENERTASSSTYLTDMTNSLYAIALIASPHPKGKQGKCKSRHLARPADQTSPPSESQLCVEIVRPYSPDVLPHCWTSMTVEGPASSSLPSA